MLQFQNKYHSVFSALDEKEKTIELMLVPLFK